MKITKRQKELLQAIYNAIRDNGYPPSFDEIKQLLGIKSNQAILDHLTALEAKGLIKREEKAARSIKINLLGYQAINARPLIPVAGTSYAGSMTETVATNSWHQVATNLKISHDVFLIEISGDSMQNAGIFPKDQLLAKPTAEFVNRDIVVAELEGTTTVKRFITQNRPPYIYLKPENEKYDIILFKPGTTMQAKIIGKYKGSTIVPLNPKTKSFDS